MSAFLVDPEHINVMLYAGLTEHFPGGHLSWSYWGPEGAMRVTLTKDNVDRVGQMLLDANAASVNHRYDEDDMYVHRYRRPTHTTWSPVELLKAIDCYVYQSEEVTDWVGSQAWAFCQQLTGHIIESMPGYDEADTWEITPRKTPMHLHTKGA